MISLEDILTEVRSHNPDADVELIRNAYSFAAKAHKGQVRLSGNPYITHLLEVSMILARFKMDTTVIISGLLHDVVEDTDRSIDDIRKYKPTYQPRNVCLPIPQGELDRHYGILKQNPKWE